MDYVHTSSNRCRLGAPTWLFLLPLLVFGSALASCGDRGGGAKEDLPPTVLPPPVATIAPLPTEAPPEPVDRTGAPATPTPDAPVAATPTDDGTGAVNEFSPVPSLPPPTAAPTPTPTATPEPFAGAGGAVPDDGLAAVLEFSVPLGSPTMKLVMPAPVEGGWPEPTFVREVVLLDSRDMRFGRMFVGPDVPIVLEGWDAYRDVELEVIDPTGDGTNHRTRPGHPDQDGGGFVLTILPKAPLGTWTLRAKQNDRLFSVATFELVAPPDPKLWVELVRVRARPERTLFVHGAGYETEAEVPLHLYEVFETLGPDETLADIIGTEREVYEAVYAGPLGAFRTDRTGQARHRVLVPGAARPSCWLVQTDPPALADNPTFGPRMHMFHTWDEPEEGRFGFEAACRPLEGGGRYTP